MKDAADLTITLLLELLLLRKDHAIIPQILQTSDSRYNLREGNYPATRNLDTATVDQVIHLPLLLAERTSTTAVPSNQILHHQQTIQ